MRKYESEHEQGNPYNFEKSVNIKDLMDIPIIIHRFFVREQNYMGNVYDKLTFEYSYDDIYRVDERFVSNTSSGVLINQLTKEKEKGLPVLTKITKVKNYYTLSEV